MKKYRVHILLFLGLSSSIMSGGICAEPSAISVDFEPLRNIYTDEHLKLELALEVIAETGPDYTMGKGPNGPRRLVTISGGKFRGKNLSGKVLPGGTDRQIVRSDGLRELDARYELLSDDGAVIFINNMVLLDETTISQTKERYARSTVKIEAPEGPHDWLNKKIIVGTLHSLRPEKPYVYLRFYTLN